MTAAAVKARYQGPLPAGLLAHIEEHLIEYSVTPTVSDNRLTVRLAEADVAIDLGQNGLSLSISASNEVQLHQIRESVLYLLDHVCPEAAADLKWNDAVPATTTPPNFHLAEVLGVSRVSANFLRVEMACGGVAGLLTGGMHFSLLLPPTGRAPVWPTLAANRRTVWPEGADSLHRAAYTFVTLDPAAGRFTFDIYEHAGGSTTDWAHIAKPGDRAGIMGPGGGDFPKATHLVLAGDETALPAIRRILAAAPARTTGIAVLELGDLGDRCEIAAPSGVDVRWIDRANRTLWDELAALGQPDDDPFVWVAAEREVARRAKQHFRAAWNLAPERQYFSGYWVR